MRILRLPRSGALLLLSLWLSTPVPAQSTTSSLIEAVEAARVPVTGTAKGGPPETLLQTMQRLHVPGMSITVVHDFHIEWAKGYGVGDVATGIPVNTETRFQAASISKPVTAMAALRLARQGSIDLDQDVNVLLRGWKLSRPQGASWPPVTPRSLFRHTSGAADGFGFPGYAPDAPLPTIEQELDGRPPSVLGPVTFDQPPYTASRYSGGGILVMQKALTDMTGKPFESLMQQLVLRPLGMAHSSFDPPKGDSAEYARAYDATGRRMDAPRHFYPEKAAAGL